MLFLRALGKLGCTNLTRCLMLSELLLFSNVCLVLERAEGSNSKIQNSHPGALCDVRTIFISTPKSISKKGKQKRIRPSTYHDNAWFIIRSLSTGVQTVTIQMLFGATPVWIPVRLAFQIEKFSGYGLAVVGCYSSFLWGFRLEIRDIDPLCFTQGQFRWFHHQHTTSNMQEYYSYRYYWSRVCIKPIP